MNNKTYTKEWAIKTLVPEEVYTDREFFLDYFYKAAKKAQTRRTMSTVLLGQRRMGKTEIFKRVVNRLFFEQDHRDPEAVVPVYYSFPEKATDRWDFASDYVENFMRWYVAFRLRDPQLLSAETYERHKLLDTIRHNQSFTKTFKATLGLIETILKTDVALPEKRAVWLPRRISDYDDSTIVIFIDEFQNTRLPQYDFDIVGYMQEAVESPTCPHFITGSAMSILTKDILGRGALFGRFDHERIEPLTGYFGTELTRKAAKYHQVPVKEEIAPIVAERCGSNPFYITAVIRQAAKLGKTIVDEETLNAILAIDLSSGFIFGELSDQVNKWIERINEYGITKWVLYLSALEQGERLDLERIQQQLIEKEAQHVSIDKIREVLIKLSRGDLIDYRAGGFWKIDDPILVDFLKVWGKIDVEKQERSEVRDELRQQYRKLKRQFSELKGYLAEVYMAQILLNAQRQTLSGHYFHQPNEIEIPDFSYVSLRERLGAGQNAEIDVHGAAGIEQWVAESKWVKDKVGISEIQKLLDKAEMVRKHRNADIVRVWFFSYNGFTKDAENFMQDNDVLWSTRAELDELLEYVNLRKLPTF
jgi:DNA-binding transcriptional MerR regulator